MSTKRHNWMQVGRRRFMFGACGLVATALGARAVDLQLVRSDFLRDQARERHVRSVPIPAHRGMLLDRNDQPLAISTPVWSIWGDPKPLLAAREQWPALADALGMPFDQLATRITGAAEREFLWLRRRLTPAQADAILGLGVPGVARRREYRRYYPTAEVTGHVLGFTGIDDRGREGLELAYDEWLEGRPGRKRVVIDRLGRTISDLELVREAEPGRDLVLTIDRRIQYLAYRELKATVKRHSAASGSMVVLDVHTGEVLAMVNQPAFNPNDGSDRESARLRNRAVTDSFEPGSTLKTFTIAAAMESGGYSADTPVFTAPGTFRVGGHTISDYRDLGELDVGGVLRKSSNVGASRIALSLTQQDLWGMFARCGLGTSTGSGFPGEAGGKLTPAGSWSEVEQATIAFGYGIAITPIQLARAYAAVAADGVLPEITLRKGGSSGNGERVMSSGTAREIRKMLEGVVSPTGTGVRAAVSGYRVAGKTGTVHKTVAGGYAADRYRALFAGFAPASNPRLAAVTIIDEPQGEHFYGGQVAAPLFARVMAGSLRLLDIPPDNIDDLRDRSVHVAGGPA